MAGDATIKGIEFQVIGEAKSAQDSLSALAATLKRLKQTIGGGLGMNTLVKNLEKLSNVSNNVNTENIKKLASALRSFGKIEINPAAVKSIKDVAKAFSSFNMKKMAGVAESMSALAKLKGFGSENFKSGMASLVYGLQQIQGMDLSNLEKAGAAAKDLADAFRQARQGTGKDEKKPLIPKPSSDTVQEYINAFDAIFAAIKQLIGKAAPLFEKLCSIMKSAVAGVARGAGRVLTMPFKSGVGKIQEYTKSLSSVLGGFKRIVGYRIIRSVIREITQAFSEGIKNLYGWSQMVGGQFAASMDQITTSLAYFKNSIAAAVAPIINALAPAIDFLIDKAVALINVLNQLFALLSGATSWTRATKKAQEYGDAVGGAGGAAKEAMKYLAPFDELNVLPDDKNGGGGGGGGNAFSDMFEEVSEFSESIKNFADMIKEKVKAGDWQGLGELLGNKVNELVDKIDFAGLGKKVGKGINAWFTTKYWTLETINFQNIGAKIAEFLNNALGEINFNTVGRTITQKFTILGDFIIGAVQNIDWHLVGKSIGDFVRGSFDQMSEWLAKVDWNKLGQDIPVWIGNAIDGLDVGTLANSIWNLLKGAVDAAIGLLSGLGQWLFGGGDLEIKMELKSGIAGIGAWIKREVLDPIVGAFDDFIAQHPTIAKVLGLESGGISTGVTSSAIGDSRITVPVEAEATTMKDKIPKNQKVISGNNAKVDKITDTTTEEDKTFPTTSKFTKVKDALTQQAKTLLTTSKFASVKDALSAVQRTLNTISNFTGKKDSLTTDQKTFNTTANMTKRKDSLTTEQKTFSSVANFKSKQTNFDATFSSFANFIKGWWHDKDHPPVIDAKAKFTTVDKSQIGTVTVPGRVQISGYTPMLQASGGAYYGNRWHDIPQAASGGKFHGTLFWAGESGAEVVGHAGGRTEVLNRSQLASTMYAAVVSGISQTIGALGAGTSTNDDNEEMVYRAMLRALNDSDYNDRPIQLDGYSVYQSVVKRNRQEQKRMGVNPMMAY